MKFSRLVAILTGTAEYTHEPGKLAGRRTSDKDNLLVLQNNAAWAESLDFTEYSA